MKQVKVWVDPLLAEAFKAVCLASGVSMASELSTFMSWRTEILQHSLDKYLSRSKSRGGRRKEVALIISRLEKICNDEEAYQSKIPENLQSGPAYEAAEQSLDSIEQAIELLREAY
jgi:hypothetical protein